MASSSGTAETPPPYYECDPRMRDDLRSIQDDCADICSSEVARLVIGQSPDHAFYTKRLRRFLRHVLHSDYFPEEKHYITYENEADYLIIATNVPDIWGLKSFTASQPTAQVWSDTISQTIRDAVYNPARQMGIPERIVMSMIVRYSANLDESGTYRGCFRSLTKGGSYREICDKIRIDANLIIPAATAMEEGRSGLRKRLQDAADEALRGYTALHREFLANTDGSCRYNGQLRMEPIFTANQFPRASRLDSTGDASQSSHCRP